MSNIVLLHTATGKSFSKRIQSSIEWINKKNGANFSVKVLPVSKVYEIDSAPIDTLIHSRAAHPTAQWMDRLSEMHSVGFKVINSPSVLKLTSDKLACSLLLQDHFPHPRTYETSKKDFNKLVYGLLKEGKYGDYIVKPYTSMDQGALVEKFTLLKKDHPVSEFDEETLFELTDKMENGRLVVQEYVNYTAIYRVIVIGGKALPYSFVDKPELHPDNWKVSVCLNKTSMQFVGDPDPALLKMGEDIQKFIGGDINFIDIFETNPGEFIISEINTACNLRIHEMLSKKAGRPDWNIHYRIAKYLVKMAQEK
jgi:glutathione synthase/RimK-type ligase-like ATP-grasp enzyme